MPLALIQWAARGIMFFVCAYGTSDYLKIVDYLFNTYV